MAIGTKALRRGLVRGLVVVCAFGVVSVADAAAKTVTVGQLFTPTFSCNANYTVLVTGVASGSSYVVPKAGVITSWSFQDGATSVTGLKLKVGRNAGSGNYEVVGEATAGTQTANTVNTYATHISVKAGDLVGVYENGGDCLMPTGNALDTYGYASGDVLPGTTTAFTFSAQGRFPVAAKVALDCVVPNLKGKTLKGAKKALKAASCTLGTVVRPKGHRRRVTRQKPAAGRVLAPEAKVDVWLG